MSRAGEEGELRVHVFQPLRQEFRLDGYDGLPDPLSLLKKKAMMPKDSDFVSKLRKFMKQEYYTQVDLAQQINCSQAKVSTFLCLRMSDRAHSRMVALIREWMARTDHSSGRLDRAQKALQSQQSQRRRNRRTAADEEDSDATCDETTPKKDKERSNSSEHDNSQSENGDTAAKPKRKKSTRKPRSVVEAILRAPPPEVDFTPPEFKEPQKSLPPAARYVRKLQSDLATALSTPMANLATYEMVTDEQSIKRAMSEPEGMISCKRRRTVDLFCNERPESFEDDLAGRADALRPRVRVGIKSPFSSNFAPPSSVFSSGTSDTAIVDGEPVDSEMALAARGLLGLCRYSQLHDVPPSTQEESETENNAAHTDNNHKETRAPEWENQREGYGQHTPPGSPGEETHGENVVTPMNVCAQPQTMNVSKNGDHVTDAVGTPVSLTGSPATHGTS